MLRSAGESSKAADESACAKALSVAIRNSWRAFFVLIVFSLSWKIVAADSGSGGHFSSELLDWAYAVSLPAAARLPWSYMVAISPAICRKHIGKRGRKSVSLRVDAITDRSAVL